MKKLDLRLNMKCYSYFENQTKKSIWRVNIAKVPSVAHIIFICCTPYRTDGNYRNILFFSWLKFYHLLNYFHKSINREKKKSD